MKEQFATYEASKMLKKLGYDEKCLCGYDKLKMLCTMTCEVFIWTNYNSSENYCSAPLWQQVENWLWNEHKIWVHVFMELTIHYKYCLSENLIDKFHSENFNSPITAKIEGIIKAIKYLHENIKP